MKNSRTKLLMHHTKTIETLQSILSNGLKFYYSNENFTQDFHVAIPMVCFCDMPLSNISDHVEHYGHYAIGFNKRSLIKKYYKILNPVNYIISAQQFKIVEQLRKAAKQMPMTSGEDPENLLLSFNDACYILGYMKPFSNNANYSSREYYEYYKECEWRMLLPENSRSDTGEHYNWIWNQSEFNEWNKTYKESGRLMESNLPIMEFDTDDIEIILLKNKRDIPVIINFITEEMATIGGSDAIDDYQRSLLLTRIRCLEEMEDNY